VLKRIYSFTSVKWQSVLRDSLFSCNAIPAIALHFVALEPDADVDCVRIAQGESPCQRAA
jgi:hypothetical protein